MAALFRKQYPQYMSLAAWCPGGRQSAKAPVAPSRSACAAVSATSTAPSEASHVPALIELSDEAA